jgi:hypothetical protein
VGLQPLGSGKADLILFIYRIKIHVSPKLQKGGKKMQYSGVAGIAFKPKVTITT